MSEPPSAAPGGEPPESTGEPQRHAVRLTRLQRAALGTSAAAFWAAALWVLLRGLDGVAVLGVVVIAGICTLLSILGVVPQRLKAGEQEVELYEVIEQRQREIEVATEIMDQDQLEQAVGRIEDEAVKPFAVRSQFSDALRFERRALDRLDEASRFTGMPMRNQTLTAGRLWDAAVELPDGRLCYVEFKLRINRDRLLQIAQSVPPGQALLVVAEVTVGGHWAVLAALPTKDRENIELASPTAHAIAAALYRLASGAGRPETTV